MSVSSDKSIYISIWLYGEGWVPAGEIRFNEEKGLSGFSYFQSYINNDYPPLNPATLNYRTTGSRHFGIDPAKNKEMLDRTFWELLPIQGDFGTSVILSKYPQYHSMVNVQKLYFLGNRMVGGLSSYVEKENDESNIVGVGFLDKIRKESVDFYLKEVQKMYNYNAFDALTSYGGVRPKAMYKDDDGSFWIAKFNLPTDPYNMARVEHTAMLMAKDSGMVVPRTKVLVLPSGEDVFLTERFDRADNNRFHSLSLFSLYPGIDIDKAKMQNPMAPHLKGNLSSVMGTIVKSFSDFKDKDTMNMVLKFLIDVGLNNTDNHLRNTRMILNRNNKWELSPMFDVIFNPASQPFVYNPGGIALGDTYLDSPGLIQGLAEQMGIEVGEVYEKSLKVKSVTSNYEYYCKMAGVSLEDKKKIEMAVTMGMSGPEALYRYQQKMKQKMHQDVGMQLKQYKPK